MIVVLVLLLYVLLFDLVLLAVLMDVIGGDVADNIGALLMLCLHGCNY